MQRRAFLSGAIATMAVAAARPPAVMAGDFAPTSLLYVYDTDPVASSFADLLEGSPAFGVRSGYKYRYFANEKSSERYRGGGSAFPDLTEPTTYAFGGADIVERYRNGVREPYLGNLIAGKSEHIHWHNYAIYRFATIENQAAFAANPAMFALPVGGYCVGAMSENGTTPGDPRRTVYLWPVRTWAVFGSENGLKWASIPSDELQTKFNSALDNYRHRFNDA